MVSLYLHVHAMIGQVESAGAPAVRLIGTVAIVRGDVTTVVDRPRRRAVLAALALRAGQPVRRADLVRAVWGEAPPQSAPGNLHTYVSGLRKMLGQPPVLITDRDGYRLDVRAQDVDVLEFGRCVDRAAETWSAGDVDGCLEAAEEADGLWQGPALPDIDGPYGETERRKLDERWLDLRQLRVRALLASGRAAEAVAECAGLAYAYPFDEQVAILRGTSLYRNGQAADALTELDGFRRHIRAELGTQPSAEFGRLYERLLGPDVESAVVGGPAIGQAGAVSPAATVPAAARFALAQLTHRPWGFVGRVGELAELSDVNSQPVLFSGHAGIGKSALALTLAHDIAPRFPDGQLHFDLGGSAPTGPAPLADVLDRQLNAFGVHDDDLPRAVADKAARLRSLLAERRVLVVLDDAADADQVAPLLPEGNNSAAIITSRRRLSPLRGVRRAALSGLPPAAAAELLVSGCGSRLDVDPTDRWVIRLAQLCGCVPLALRLAAARLAEAESVMEGVRALVRELGAHEDRLAALSPDDLDQTVSILAGFEQMGRQLSGPAWSLLARLSEFPLRDFEVASLTNGHDPLGSIPAERLPAVLDELVEAGLLDLVTDDQYRLPVLVGAYGRRLAWAEGSAPRRFA